MKYSLFWSWAHGQLIIFWWYSEFFNIWSSKNRSQGDLTINLPVMLCTLVSLLLNLLHAMGVSKNMAEVCTIQVLPPQFIDRLEKKKVTNEKDMWMILRDIYHWRYTFLVHTSSLTFGFDVGRFFLHFCFHSLKCNKLGSFLLMCIASKPADSSKHKTFDGHRALEHI